MSIEVCRHCARPVDTDFDGESIAVRVCVDCLEKYTIAELQKLLLEAGGEMDRMIIAEIIAEKVCKQ